MRRLETVEIAGYRNVIDPELAARVRILKVPVLPPGAAGMTIGRFVLLTNDDDRSGERELLAHELVHVRQYHEYGLVGFLWRYLVDYLKGVRTHRRHRKAYLEIPFEEEARTLTKRWGRTPPPKPPPTRT